MLKLSGVCKSFGDKVILKDFSYDFKESGLVIIKGPSGCGKTTLLRLIADLEKADSGEIIKNGVISLLFQEDRLLPWLSAIENVTCVMSGKSAEKKDEAKKLLDFVGLEGEENERIENLSGGMKRRVAFARALALCPYEVRHKKISRLSGGMKRRVAILRAVVFGGDLLILDEPFNGLDLETKQKLVDITLRYSQKHLVIMVTHSSDDLKLTQEVISF